MQHDGRHRPRRGFFSTALVQMPLLAVLFVPLIIGCGRRDLGGISGKVVSAGAARGFTPPESMSLVFVTRNGNIPMSYSASVRPDGSFAVDMNNGTGRGIPQGAYDVTINVNDLLMRMPDARAKNELDQDYDYPRPSKEIKNRLARAKCSVTLKAGARLSLLVDLDAGSITVTGS